MADEQDDGSIPPSGEVGRLFIPISETELWQLINLLAAAAGTFEYVSNTALDQHDLETAEVFQARAQLARLFNAKLGKLLSIQYKDSTKH